MSQEQFLLFQQFYINEWFQWIRQMNTQNLHFPSSQIQQTESSLPQQSWQMILEDEKQSLTRGSLTETNQILRQLDLDDLIKQGRLYKEESSNSFNEQQKCQEKKKNLQQGKHIKKQLKQRIKVDKVQSKEKHIQLGLKSQQLTYTMSKLKPKLIRVYQKNNDKFQQLFDNLKIIHPECTDMDVIRLLELGNHNFDSAFKLLQQSELFVHYYLTVQSNKNRQDLSDQEQPIKKK